MSVKRGFSVCETEGCCGVCQIVGFSEELSEWYGADYDHTGKTLGSVYKKLYKDMMGLDKGYVYQIWFVKQRSFEGIFNADFEAEELRQLVMGIPNVRSLGSTTNPNSGNIIEGYQWIA